MCFSEEVSLFSFIIGIVGSALCISLGETLDKIVGWGLGFVSLMQGIEFLLWRHQKCDWWNRILSLFGMLFNHLQPLVFVIIVSAFNPFITKTDRTIILTILGIYLIAIIPYSIPFITDPTLQCTLKFKNAKFAQGQGQGQGHLLWEWNNMKYSTLVYSLFLLSFCITFIFGFPNRINGWIAAFVAVIIFTLSRYLYPTIYNGTLWCFFTAFLPIIYYFVRICI